MKFITRTFYLLVCLLTFNNAFAQNNLQEPVRFKLKNGLTVIVAQNKGLGKIYSRLTIENEIAENQKNEAQVFGNFLAIKADQFNQAVVPAVNKVTTKINLSVDEANTTTNVENFEQALQFISDNLLNAEIAQQAFENIKNENTTLADMQSFYRNHFKASDTFITIVGDIDPASAKTAANKIFGNWKSEVAL
jgi:predicted Zn-dependent peptidase